MNALAKTSKPMKPGSNCYPFIIQMKNEFEPAQKSPSLAPVFRAAQPRMHLWATTNTAESTPGSDWEESFVYSTPTTQHQLPNLFREESPIKAMLHGLVDPEYNLQCLLESRVC